MDDTSFVFLRFCYKFKGKMCEVNIVQLHYSPLYILPWTTLFTFFYVYYKFKGKKILNLVELMVRVHPSSFTMDDIVQFFFCLGKNIYIYIFKLILFLFLFLFLFRLIFFLSFMLFRKLI